MILTPEEIICPECKGEGGVRGMRLDEFVTQPCNTCKGTGKVHRDSPDREKIARIICCFANGEAESRPVSKSCAECEFNTPKTPFPDCFPDIRSGTDKFLALFPDIEQLRERQCVGLELCCDLEAKLEQAKREARGEVLKIVLKVAKDREKSFGSQRGWVSDILQALKGEK